MGLHIVLFSAVADGDLAAAYQLKDPLSVYLCTAPAHQPQTHSQRRCYQQHPPLLYTSPAHPGAHQFFDPLPVYKPFSGLQFLVHIPVH